MQICLFVFVIKSYVIGCASLTFHSPCLSCFYYFGLQGPTLVLAAIAPLEDLLCLLLQGDSRVLEAAEARTVARGLSTWNAAQRLAFDLR